jgi:hypothetical protein
VRIERENSCCKLLVTGKAHVAELADALDSGFRLERFLTPSWRFTPLRQNHWYHCSKQPFYRSHPRPAEASEKEATLAQKLAQQQQLSFD